MPGFVTVAPVVGLQPETMFVPTTTQQHPLGFRVTCYDSNGAFGGGEFVYAKAAQAILLPGRLCYLDYDGTAVEIPNTGSLGMGIVVAMNTMEINTYGWFQLSGLLAVQTAASVAAGVAVGIGAAGQAGTNAANKQLQGGRVVKASTYAVTKTVNLTNGKKYITLGNQAWLFQGLPVTGTGVGASAVITSLDPSGTQINVDVASTATGPITATFTYTGFLLIYAPNGLIAQGA